MPYQLARRGRRAVGLTTLMLALTAVSASACPSDGGSAPSDIKTHFCAAWDAAPAGALGYPTGNAFRWGAGWLRTFDGGTWGRGGIAEGDGVGFAYVIGQPWWNTYEAAGGGPGPLQYPTGRHEFGGHINDGPRANKYMTLQGGVINNWAAGTFETHGAILTKWNSLGNVSGPVGRPTSNEEQTARVNGRYSTFEGGNIIYNPRINGTFHIYGGFLNKYRELGYSNHALGLPTSDRQHNATRGNDYQLFDGGAINQYGGDAYETHGAIFSKWNALGGANGPVGLPISDEGPTARVAGRFSRFQGGNIYYNERLNGTFHVYGGVLTKYLAVGYSNHALGLPTSDRQHNPVRGNEYQTFDGGVINQYGGNAYETHGAILAKWNALGGPNGPVGLPTSDEQQTARIDGRYATFEGGNLIFNPATGDTFHVYGGILTKYRDLGYSSHPLGLPTSDRRHNDVRSNDYQTFQGGVINQYGGNAYETHGAILAKWNALGGPNGPVGLPTSDEQQTARIDGRYATFEGGNLIFNPATGDTFHVYGGILTKYRDLGYSSHPLGLPTSDRRHNDRVGNDYQLFQGGVINQYGGNAYETHGAILKRWERTGGPSGSLGLPTSDEANTARSPQGTVGRYSRFQRGVINYVPRLDRAFVLFGAIGDKYAQMNYARSYLGLPTSEEFRWNDGVRQNFEGGYIYYRSGRGAKTDRELGNERADPNAGLKVRAIGDSVTAGFGFDSFGHQQSREFVLGTCFFNVARSDCQSPSQASYPSLFARGNGVRRWANLAQSGSTPRDWLEGRLRNALVATRNYKPDITLLTLGANPLLHEFMLTPGGQWCTRAPLSTRDCIRERIAEQHITTRLSAIYKLLLQAPRNHVLVVLYPLSNPRPLVGTDVNYLLSALNAEVASAVSIARRSRPRDAARIRLVSPGPFKDHACGSREPWILSSDLCIHPNISGHQQLARAVARQARAMGVLR